MTITLLCTNVTHPVVPWLRRWQAEQQARGHTVALCADKKELTSGDILFLVSCGQIIREAERNRYRAVLVLHASDLPQDRGWSPHIWNIVEGANRITVSLLEARDPLDTGDIWKKVHFDLAGHELLPEINERLFAAELALMTEAVDGFGTIEPTPQAPGAGPHRRQRTAADSRLDPDQTLARQFDLLRVVDNDRYPAFMDYRGARYLIRIEKAPHES